MMPSFSLKNDFLGFIWDFFGTEGSEQKRYKILYVMFEPFSIDNLAKSISKQAFDFIKLSFGNRKSETKIWGFA